MPLKPLKRPVKDAAVPGAELPSRYALAADALGKWEAAPAACAAVICFASSVGFSSSRVTSDQMEVCLLAQWGDVAFRLNSYSRHYSTPFAFSILLYPPGHRPTLRLPTRGGTWWAYRVPSRQPDG
jgi:hypothetical protein